MATPPKNKGVLHHVTRWLQRFTWLGSKFTALGKRNWNCFMVWSTRSEKNANPKWEIFPSSLIHHFHTKQKISLLAALALISQKPTLIHRASRRKKVSNSYVDFYLRLKSEFCCKQNIWRLLLQNMNNKGAYFVNWAAKNWRRFVSKKRKIWAR